MAGHEGFDRITFEFDEGGRLGGTPDPSAPGVPGWYIEPADPPFEYDPTAEPVVVGGRFFLRFSITGTRHPEGTYPKEIVARLPVLVEAEEEQDFHGGVSWILGLADQRCWTVTELPNPPRIAIDIPR